MELTKREAKSIIYQRISRERGKMNFFITILCFISCCALFAGILGFALEEGVSSYIIPTSGELIISGGKSLFNGNPIENTTPNNQGKFLACYIIGAIVFVPSIMFVVSKPGKIQKRLIEQWEADGSLPPIPEKKRKDVKTYH